MIGEGAMDDLMDMDDEEQARASRRDVPWSGRGSTAPHSRDADEVAVLGVMREMASKGIGVSLRLDGSWSVDGFYKSGKAIVRMADGVCRISTRWDRSTTVRTTDFADELIDVNREWWELSKDRWEGWCDENPNWVEYRKSRERRFHDGKT